MTLQIKKDALKEEKVVEAEPEVKAPVTEEDMSVYGSKSHTLEFVCCLGDPSQKDTTKNRVTGKKDITPQIVGYHFRALEDMEVPDFGLDANFKKDRMNFVDITKFKHVKNGEDFLATPFEAAYLLSQKEFNGTCTGGKIPVTCGYALSNKNSKSTIASADKVPNVILRGKTGSLKDAGFEDVLTTEEVLVDGRKTIKRTIKPGYEKWAPLCAKARRASSTSKKATGSIINQNAQQFLAIVKKKTAKM